LLHASSNFTTAYEDPASERAAGLQRLILRVGEQLLPQQPRELPSIPVCVALAALITWRRHNPTGFCPSFSGGVAIVSLKRAAPSNALQFRV
jgi:hypothetical protein